MVTASARYSKSGEADVFTANSVDGAVGVVAFRSTLLAGGSRFAATLKALAASLDGFATEASAAIARLLPIARSEELRRIAAARLSRPYQDVTSDVQAAKRDYASRAARIAEPPPALPFAVEDRQWFRSLDFGQQAQWIMSADASQLAAIIVAGRLRFPGLTDELWGEVVERYAVLAHVQRTGLQADYQLKSTPDEPAAIGPDADAAEQAARDAVERFYLDQVALSDAESVLRSVIVAVAVATDLSVDDAFALLTGTAR